MAVSEMLYDRVIEFCSFKPASDLDQSQTMNMVLSISARALTLIAASWGLTAVVLFAQQMPNASTLRQAPSQTRPAGKQHQQSFKPSSEHLEEWIDRHSSLTLPEQQRALEQEPGFHDLPPQTQQRMRDQLGRLSSMPPNKRQRILETNEWIEKLTADQRTQVREATKQLASLPPTDRRYVARTFRGLRELSPAQRENVLNSDRFAHLTPEQRATLDKLMKVEPLLPPAYDGDPAASKGPAH